MNRYERICGKIVRSGVLQAIIRDTTGRKRGEELLKQSEEQLRNIFEASYDGILVENNETISYVNKSYVYSLKHAGQNLALSVQDFQ